MSKPRLALLLMLCGVVSHISLFEWKVGSTHYSDYVAEVRESRGLDRNDLLFLQIGESEFSREPRYDGYKRGWGIFFRPFVSTDTLRFGTVLFGVVLSIALVIIGVLFLLGQGKAKNP